MRYLQAFLLAIVPLLFVSLWGCRPASPLSDNPEVIAAGESLFSSYCASCHHLQADGIGPGLGGVTQVHAPLWLVDFIKNPGSLIEAGDTAALAVAARYGNAMPAFSFLDDAQLLSILSYLQAAAPELLQRPAASQSTIMGSPLENPVPDTVIDSGITLELQEWTSFPATSPDLPQARINMLRSSPGAKPRIFVNDLRGKLYVLDERTPQLFLDLPSYIPDFIHTPGLGTGFGSFVFHPDFAENGLFYTTHTEKADAASSDFPYHDSIPVTLQWVLSEWSCQEPGGDQFDGTRRELLRINMPTGIHGVQDIQFRTTARATDPDRGYLYIGVGDGGSTEQGFDTLCCRYSSVHGAILRIDPAGTNAANGRYGIPPDNPFATVPGARPELWAMGFRNPHRFHWDAGGDGKMLIGEIGQDQIEEINIGLPGRHYGWNHREGTFLLYPIADLHHVYSLPARDSIDFVYPVAQYDHDEGNAIAGGFVYRGRQFPFLAGKYLFGDILKGYLFYVEADGLTSGRQAPIYALQIRVDGRLTTFRELMPNQRIDLHLGQDHEGGIYLLSKTYGTIWKVKAAYGEKM